MKAEPEKMRQDRYDELKNILEERRLEIIGELQHKMRDVRSQDASIFRQDVRDDAESSEAQIQDDIDLALLQMKAETLKKIARALISLEESCYGYCYECRAELSEQRLRALPFAVRCKDCEEIREVSHQHELFASRREVTSLFANSIG